MSPAISNVGARSREGQRRRPKQSEGFEAKHRCLICWLWLVPRPPAVAKFKGDAKRKAAPMGWRSQACWQSKGSCERPISRWLCCGTCSLRCVWYGRWPIRFASTFGTCMFATTSLSWATSSGCSTSTRSCTSNRTRFGFASVSQRSTPSWFSTRVRRNLRTTQEWGAGPLVVELVPAPMSNFNSDASRWFHKSGGFNESHMFVVPESFLSSFCTIRRAHHLP